MTAVLSSRRRNLQIVRAMWTSDSIKVRASSVSVVKCDERLCNARQWCVSCVFRRVRVFNLFGLQ